MYKLFEFTCTACLNKFEDLIEAHEAPPACPECQEPSERQALSYHPTKAYDPHWSEVFRKGATMRARLQGKLPWRKSSWSQTD